MKTQRDYFIRIKQVLKQGLLANKGLTKAQERKVLKFIDQNSADLREMSLRVAIKLADLIKRNPASFEKMARVTVLRGL